MTVIDDYVSVALEYQRRLERDPWLADAKDPDMQRLGARLDALEPKLTRAEVEKADALIRAGMRRKP